MKRHLNTLFVTTQGAYLSRDGETVKVRVEQETRLRVPIHMLGGIVCFGRIGCSPAMLGLCARREVGVSFLSFHGRFLARVRGPTTGNVLLRREQYRRSDDEAATADLARAMVSAKILNARAALQRALRDLPGTDGRDDLQQAIRRLRTVLGTVARASTVDSVRGYEGEAARVYFSAFDSMIKARKATFRFTGRTRRPPLDPINALLSFLYTLLLHDVVSALETVGLDPAVGFLHRDRPGRPGLALDLMEELRPIFADRMALALINKRRLRGKDFERQESGAVWLGEGGRKTVLEAYQRRKQDELTHPFLEEKVTVGLLPHLQARLLARHLRGDLDAYPPYLWH